MPRLPCSAAALVAMLVGHVRVHALEQCAKVGPLTLRWTLDGDMIEYQVEGAVSGDGWMGFGFASTERAAMVGSDVVISGFVGDEAFSSSYALTSRSSGGVRPSEPDVELLDAMRGDGVMWVRARRPLATWPVDGGRAVVWATGPVGGTGEDPVVEYHGSSHTLGGATGTLVLGEAQDTCSV